MDASDLVAHHCELLNISIGISAVTMSNTYTVNSSIGAIQGSVFATALSFALYRTGKLVYSTYEKSIKIANSQRAENLMKSSDAMGSSSLGQFAPSLYSNNNSLLSKGTVMSGATDASPVGFRQYFPIFIRLLISPKFHFHTFMIAYMTFQIANGFLIYHDAA